MDNQTKAEVMKKEIWMISNYRALIISKYFLSLCLFIAFYFARFFQYIMSPMYILIVLNAFPPILSFAFKDYAKKNDNKFSIYATKERPFLLNSLKRKYNYSRVNDISNSLTFLLTLLLLSLWQYNFNTLHNIPNKLIYLPSMIVITSVILRLFGIIFYKIKLHYTLIHNRL